MSTGACARLSATTPRRHATRRAPPVETRDRLCPRSNHGGVCGHCWHVAVRTAGGPPTAVARRRCSATSTAAARPSDCERMSLGARASTLRAGIQYFVMRHPGTNPLQRKSASNGCLRRCDRVELTEVCAAVAPQARTRLVRRPSHERCQNTALHAGDGQLAPEKKDVAASAGTRRTPSARQPLFSGLSSPCGHQTAATLATVATSALPQLWGGTRVPVMSPVCSSAFASPSSILGPSIQLPSFHIFSRTFPLSAPPRDACTLMM